MSVHVHGVKEFMFLNLASGVNPCWISGVCHGNNENAELTVKIIVIIIFVGSGNAGFEASFQSLS